MAQRVNTRFVTIVSTICLLLVCAIIYGPRIKERLQRRPPAERAAAFEAEANNALKQGRFSDARENISAAWHLDPTNKELCLRRGDLLAALSQQDGQVAIEQARTSWESALAIDPGFKPALQRLLDSYIAQLDARPSGDSCVRLRDAATRSFQIDPSNLRAEAYSYIATVMLWAQGMQPATNQSRQAMVKLAEFQKKNPSDGEVLFYLMRGKTFSASEDFKSGHDDTANATIAECRAMIADVAANHAADGAVNFRVFQCYYLLMQVGRDPAQSKKDQAAADAALARAMTETKQTDAGYDRLQYEAADWAAHNGHMDQAEKILRAFYDNRKSDQRVRLALCRVLAMTGDPAKRDEAIGILSQPISNVGAAGLDSPGIVELEARTLLERTTLLVTRFPYLPAAKQDAAKAEIHTLLERVKAVAVADAIPVLRLEGSVAQMEGHNVEAVNYLSRALVLLEHSESNRTLKYELMYQLARADRFAQQNKAAEKLFLQIVEQYDGVSSAHEQLAELYIESNDLAQASRQIEILARQVPDSLDVVRLRIILAQRSGKPDEAKKLVLALPETTFEQKVFKAQFGANVQDYDTTFRVLSDMRKLRPDDMDITIAMFQASVRAGPAVREEGRKIAAEDLKRHPDNARLAALVNQGENVSPAAVDSVMNDLGPVSNDPHDLKLREARQAYAKGHIAEALARTSEAEQLKPNDPVTWAVFFELYMQQRDWDKANRAVEVLTRLNADQTGGRIYRWQYCMNRGQFSEAISVAHELTLIHENFAQSWILLAEAYQANGQFNEAVKDFQAALERQTTNMYVYKGLADCYEALSQPDRAIEAVDQGLKLFPASPYLRERRLAYLALTNPQAVVPERQKMLDQNPENPDAYLQLAASCVMSAQHIYTTSPDLAKQYTDKARDVLTKGVGKFPDHLQLNGALADAMQNANAFDAGVSILNELASRPEWKGKPDPLVMLGDYYARSNRPTKFAEAEKFFRDAWALTDNKNINIELRILTLLEANRKDPDRFDKSLKLLEANAGDPRISLQTLQVHIAANHTDLALKGITEALAKSPNDVSLLNMLAVVNIDGGRIAAAREVLIKSLQIDPHNDYSLYYQALAELRDPGNGNLNLAIQNLNAILSRSPHDVKFRREAANARLRIADIEGAVGDLEDVLRTEPYNREVRLQLLDLYTQTKQWPKFEQVVNVAETNPAISSGVWFRKHAYALAAQNRFPEALAKIRIAIEADAKNAGYARDYLTILLESKDNAGVIRETDALIAGGHHDWWIYHLRGMARYASGDTAGALAQLDEAMKLVDADKDPNDYRFVLSAIADISVDEALKRVAPRIANSDLYRLQSVKLHMRKGDWTLALNELQPLLQKLGQLPIASSVEVLRLAAEASQGGGQLEASRKYYLQWLQETPNDTAALNNFAYLLAEDLHEPDTAKRYSQQAYDAGRKVNFIDPMVVDTHAWVLTLCGGSDANVGLQLLSSLVAGHPELLDPRYHLAEAYLRQHHPSEALSQLNTAMDQIKSLEASGQSVNPKTRANIEKALDKLQIPGAATR